MNHKPTLALFLPLLCPGGAERVTLNIAAGLVAQGYPVDLVLARAGGDYLSQVPPGVRVVDLGSRRVIASLPALVRYLKTNRPAALLSALDHANLVALWARRWVRVPMRVLVAVHSTVSQDKKRSPRKRDRLIPALIRKAYPHADAVITVSEAAALDLVRETGMSPGQVHVIYNPVLRPALFEMAQVDPEDPWLTDREVPVLIAAGRLTDAKDYPMLLRAFARLRTQRKARLIILGEGEERAALEAIIAELGLTDVRLHGYTENPYAYMARADVFVLSSIWEGLPTALIEALALGRRVVATDCRSGPREILKEGAYGRLVPPGDHDALAQALAEALDAPPPAVPEEALARFRQDHATAQYLRLMVPEPPPSSADGRMTG